MADHLIDRLRRRAEIMDAMSDPLFDISKTFILEARLTLEQGAVDNNAAADRIASLETEVAGLKLYAGEKSNQYVAAMEENKALRKALEDILAPIAAATRDLEPGQRLSGMAYTILTSAENLRDIARSALASSERTERK